MEEVAYVSEDVNSFIDLGDAIEIVKQGCVENNRKDCEYRHDNGNCLKVGGFCTSVDDKHCEKMNQDGVAADVLEENRTNIPANDNSEVTEAYKINWSEMKYASYKELLSFLISNEGNEDLIGKIRVGDICIDVINHPEVEKIFFDFYVLSEDTGYGFSKGIPYSYADDFSISYNDIYVAMKQNQSMMENIENEIENHIKTFASNEYSLIEHAKRELVIW